LTPKIIGPAEKLMAEMWPGVPVLPILQAGATDGRYLIVAGIPTYGIDGSFLDTSLNHIHGLNEYAGVDQLYKDRDFLYRLVKVYADEESGARSASVGGRRARRGGGMDAAGGPTRRHRRGTFCRIGRLGAGGARPRSSPAAMSMAL
jgi:hypothetical protein